MASMYRHGKHVSPLSYRDNAECRAWKSSHRLTLVMSVLAIGAELQLTCTVVVDIMLFCVELRIKLLKLDVRRGGTNH